MSSNAMIVVHVDLNLASGTAGTGKEDAPFPTFHKALEYAHGVSILSGDWLLAVRLSGSKKWEYGE